MKIIISGHHLKISESLREYIDDMSRKHVEKYFENAVNLNVVLVKEKDFIRTEVLINQGTGDRAVVRGTGEDFDAYKSFDIALSKTETQLKKHQSRLKNHHRKKGDNFASFNAKKYVLSPFSEDNEADDDKAPVIIAEKMTSIENLTVSEAVMRMDLLDIQMLAFINSGNGRLNMVYYRHDGNIIWLDPQTSLTDTSINEKK